MMVFRRSLIAALTVAGALALPAFAHASSITTTSLQDWGTGLNGTQTFDETDPTNYPITWTHFLTFSPAAISFTSATIDIRHMGNRNNPNEVWLFDDQGGSALIGTLSTSEVNGVSFFWTDTFTIPSSLFPTFPASSWTLALRLADTAFSAANPNASANKNTIDLDYALLHLTYDDGVTTVPQAPVPEPGTLVLFGTGLAGLVAAIRRRAR